VGERAAHHEGHDDEVVMRVHVVAGATRRERLIAEHLHDAEAGDAGLVLMEVEARMAGDHTVGMAGDVAGIGARGRQV
jgi:hypothetical protein